MRSCPLALKVVPVMCWDKDLVLEKGRGCKEEVEMSLELGTCRGKFIPEGSWPLGVAVISFW